MSDENATNHISVGKMVVLQVTKRAMCSVGLLNEDVTSDHCLSSDMLLEVTDSCRLPMALAFRSTLPADARWLVVRQNAMRVLISTAILSTNIALGAGFFYLMGWITAQLAPFNFGTQIVAAILQATAMLSGTGALLCVTLVQLCQSVRRQPGISEATE